MVDKWDKEVDVIVAGYGLGGAISAITTHDAGAKVVLLEKESMAGGNSILSDGALIVSLNEKDAVTYLQHCSNGTVGQDMIEFMAKGMTEAPAYLNSLAEDVGATTTMVDMPWVLYPFPGKDSFRIWRVTGFKDTGDTDPAKPGGFKLMEMLFRHIKKRKIEVMLSAPVKRLVQENDDRITGVLAERESQEIAIKSKKGVILTTGGFEFNEWLLKQYLEIKPIYGVGPKGNTGDGILMAQKAGAALWHMWLLHACYGFKFPEYDYAFRLPFGGALNPAEPAPIPWVLVNRYGKRFMSEAMPFMQDSSYRMLEAMNCDFLGTISGVPEYPNIPCYMIFDEDGRKQGPIARPRAIREEDMYYWSKYNMTEIEKGWIKRADSVPELARVFGIDASELKKSIERWNSQCPAQNDMDFHRVPGSMVPIKTPPFYIVDCWPVVTNTQGGPQFNTKCQVVDPFGEAIPSLYKAGELGSFFGHLYTLSGNLTECVVEGRTAGNNIISEPSYQKE